MKLDINGITYHLDRHQQAPTLPTLLLLHGFMGSGRAFGHLIPRLKKTCNPITLDLLGHDRTGAPENPERFSLDRQLADLHQIVNQLESSALFLHGYSMGGRLALRFALQYPELITGLILESSNYGIEQEEKRKERKKIDEQRAQAIEADYSSFLDEWQKLPLFDSGISAADELSNHYKEIQTQQRASAMANSLRGFGTAQMPSVKDQLHQLQVPALLMAGQHDQKYRSILREMEEHIANSKFHIIKDAGHRIHLENPSAFIDHLKAFLLCASSQIAWKHRRNGS